MYEKIAADTMMDPWWEAMLERLADASEDASSSVVPMVEENEWSMVGLVVSSIFRGLIKLFRSLRFGESLSLSDGSLNSGWLFKLSPEFHSRAKTDVFFEVSERSMVKPGKG